MKKKLLSIALIALCSSSSIFSMQPPAATGPSFFEAFEENLPDVLQGLEQSSLQMKTDVLHATGMAKDLASKHPVFTVLLAASLMGKQRINACLNFIQEQPFLVAVTAIAVISSQQSWRDQITQGFNNLFATHQ